MKKIARITTQKKSKDRYNIFLNDGQDEKYGFSVDEAILVEFNLRKDLELEESTIDALIQKDTIHKSYTQAIHFLSYRMRTKKEMHDYLLKKEVDEAHINEIMEKLKTENLLDDQQFADMFVRSRMNTSTKGPMLIKKELIEKGISASLASQAVEQYPYEVQYENITKWMKKKLTTGKKDSFRKQVQQLQATLMQKGFTQDVITEALADINGQKDEATEWNALVYQGEKLLRKHETKLNGDKLRNKLKQGLFGKGFSIALINQFLEEVFEE
ncbi:recombination regulator RecX [Virgibacillus sp. NKC19-3]|uniref:recombination regulator RecX n=1 Tax=Virgibacillus saliphilus TaxID=2831674 RepID=UPI001C9A6262|nr:recombination regulator RecX [Virgibacillus sp. NKC19-3]MBY7142743.1 recombination regulator RecX [Virgibacillus sp. NKC19-3]